MDKDDDIFAVSLWILRIVLPLILFWISFGPRLQSLWLRPAVQKETMLAHRATVRAAGARAPEAVASLITVDAQEAPALFQHLLRAPERRDRTAPERPERNERVERQRPERNERGQEQRRDQKRQMLPEDPRIKEAALAEDLKKQAAQNQVHAHSLVNFVAFNRCRQQRVFLPDRTCVPPPPPPRPRKVSSVLQDAFTQAAAAKRANADAQMILRGALQVGSCGVVAARAIYAQLTDVDIEVMPLTFELIVESCIVANELKDASNFLMHMEASGQMPRSELLDQVMELFLEQRSAADQAEASQAHEKDEAAENAKSGEVETQLPLLSEAEPVNSCLHTAAEEHASGAHTLQLTELVAEPPPPPPPPPVGYHEPAEDYNHVMSYLGWDMPLHSMPMQWHQNIPNCMMPRLEAFHSSTRNGSEGTGRGAGLPAFSIPEEFAVAPPEPDDAEDYDEEDDDEHAEPDEAELRPEVGEADADEPVRKLRGRGSSQYERSMANEEEDDEHAPASEQTVCGGDAQGAAEYIEPSLMADEAARDSENAAAPKGAMGTGGWALSAGAAEFVPGAVRPSLSDMVAPPGAGSYSLSDMVGPPGRVLTIEPEFDTSAETLQWHSMHHHAPSYEDPTDDTIDKTCNVVGGGFTFSVGAASFTPMGDTHVPGAEQNPWSFDAGALLPHDPDMVLQ